MTSDKKKPTQKRVAKAAAKDQKKATKADKATAQGKYDQRQILDVWMEWEEAEVNPEETSTQRTLTEQLQDKDQIHN